MRIIDMKISRRGRRRECCIIVRGKSILQAACGDVVTVIVFSSGIQATRRGGASRIVVGRKTILQTSSRPSSL